MYPGLLARHDPAHPGSSALWHEWMHIVGFRNLARAKLNLIFFLKPQMALQLTLILMMIEMDRFWIAHHGCAVDDAEMIPYLDFRRAFPPGSLYPSFNLIRRIILR